MITAVLNGDLDHAEFEMHPVFGMMIPKRCNHVPVNMLHPRYTWADRTAYDKAAKELAVLFIKNFEKYAAGVSEEILAAAPKI